MERRMFGSDLYPRFRICANRACLMSSGFSMLNCSFLQFSEDPRRPSR